MDARTLEKPKRPTTGIAITRTIINPRRERYTAADLLAAVDIEPAPRVLIDGFDAYGYPKEFEQQTPTPERIRHCRGQIEKPEVSRTASRYNHRVKGVFELASERGAITPGQAAAGARLQAAIFGLGTMKIGSYGGGGGGGHGDERDRRDRHRRALIEAKVAIGNQALFSWLYRVAEHDLTSESAPLPPSMKHREKRPHKATIRRHYAATMETALARLAKAWKIE
jgi:hypothetical protein